MAQRTEGRPSDELSVMVIDEDKCHANSTKSMLSQLNYYVKVYTCPTEALDFLKDHAEDVDFVLASVHMEEVNGFQFLETAKEMRKNLQVIMMSTETTMFTMKTCVELGARFLVKKPLDAETIHNMWQHLDANVLKINKIKYLFRGVGDKTKDAQESGKCVVQPKDGTEMRTHLMWTPYVQRKFLSALQMLGENSSPKKIQMIMDIDTIGRKQISTHLQKHRQRIEREQEQNMKMFTDACGKGASSSKSKKARHTIRNTPKYHRYNQVHATKRTLVRSFSEDTEDKNAYSAMRRALQLGTFLDESQYSGDPSSKGSDEAAGDVMGEDGAEDEANVSKSSSHDQVVAEIYNEDAAQESTNKSICKTPVVSLVDYPDSEDFD